MNNIDLFDTAKKFITEIGIEIEFGLSPTEYCFVPGLQILQGRILVDQEQLAYPGDILHEAGHIAVVPASERYRLTGQEIEKRKDAAAEEMMSIVWSYAACLHLRIDPVFVFHSDGYHGGGSSIIENVNAG